MTTQASDPTTAPAPRAPQAGEQQRPEPAVRSQLFETMVLCRTYEEAILREYHADKGPGFDIGKGLVPGEMHLSAGQEPVAAGDLRAPDHRRRGDRHAPPAPPGDRPRRRPARDDRGDLRPRDRARPGPRRAHAPVRPGHALLLLRHHRRGLPARARPGVRVPAPRHRPDRGRRHRRGCRQPGRLPRVAQPRRALEAPGRLRRRGQRLGHLGPAYGVHRGRLERRPRRGVRHPRPPRRGQRRRGRVRRWPREAVARARAGEGPSLIEVHTLRMWGHFEGDAQGYRPELAEVPSHDPIPRYEQRLRDGRRTRRRQGRR